MQECVPHASQFQAKPPHLSQTFVIVSQTLILATASEVQCLHHSVEPLLLLTYFLSLLGGLERQVEEMSCATDTLQAVETLSAVVGQFKDIVEVAEKDPQLCETLKKVLKLTRGWEIARDHARTAVTSDNRMRVWCPQGSSQGLPPQSGLLFKCDLGSVDLENPVGKQVLEVCIAK